MKTFIFIVVLGLSALFIQPALASTTFSLPTTNTTYTVDFPTVGTGASSTPLYDFRFRLPIGTKFDRIQMSVPTSQGVYSKTPSLYIFKNVGTWFYSCPLVNCVSDDTYIKDVTYNSNTKISENVVEFTFATTTTIALDEYVAFLFNPNSSYVDFTFYQTVYSLAYGLNGYNISVSPTIPAVKFCDGVCDNDVFVESTLDPLQTQFDTKITSAVVSGASSSTLQVVVDYFLNTSEITSTNRTDALTVNIYTPDSTAFESKNKLILPLANGTSSKTINLTSSYPDGDYSASVSFYSIFTQRTVFPPWLWVNFTVSGGVVTSSSIVSVDNAIFPAQPTVLEDCGLTALSGCLNNTIKIMFYPSTESIDNIKTLFDTTMTTKAPFVYVAQISGLFNSMYTQTASSSATITINILGGSLDLISVARLQSVPFLSWLRTMLSAIIWIMASLYIYRRTLLLFNKS